MPRPSPTLRRFYAEAALRGIDPDILTARSRSLLAAHPRLVWLAKEGLLHDGAQSCSGTAADALSRLSDATAVELLRAVRRARALLHRAAAEEPLLSPADGSHDALLLALALMEESCDTLRRYPVNGALYADILAACYFSPAPLPDDLLIDRLYVERSTFYSAKREAVVLYGLILSARLGGCF